VAQFTALFDQVPPGHRPRPACERQFESAGDGNIPNASGGVSGWPLGVGDMQGRRDRKSGLHPPVRFRVGDQLEPSSMSIMKHFGPRRERLSSTRLETRTKESSDCASTRVFKTQSKKCEMKVNRRQGNALEQSPQRRPALSWSEEERSRWDPKDGELCPSRAKPGETLVEARSDTDVQIVRLTWV